MKILGLPFEFKDLTDRGTFEGLASVYGNTDLGGDIVEPGAFKEFAYTRDSHIRILDGHNTRAPIGKGKLIDSHLGLAIKGALSMEVSRAREVYALMKDGVIDGLSIGYDVLPGGSEVDDKGVRHLKSLKLWEVSTTPFPMNQAALVSAVKSVTSVRELEDYLREAVGLSKSQATAHASAVWKTLSGRRDAGEDSGYVAPSSNHFLESLNKE